MCMCAGLGPRRERHALAEFMARFDAGSTKESQRRCQLRNLRSKSEERFVYEEIDRQITNLVESVGREAIVMVFFVKRDEGCVRVPRVSTFYLSGRSSVTAPSI